MVEGEVVESNGDYDPGEHTVSEVQEYVNGLDSDEEIRAVYDAELRGKSRSTPLPDWDDADPNRPVSTWWFRTGEVHLA